MEPRVLRKFFDMKENVRIIPSMSAVNWNMDLQKIMHNYPTLKGKQLKQKYYTSAAGKNHVENKQIR